MPGPQYKPTHGRVATNTLHPGQHLRRPRASTIISFEDQNVTEKTGDLETLSDSAQMFCSRCVLPFLALYMLPEETSSALLPSRNKREMKWLDEELFPRLHDPSDQGDLSVGDAGEMDRDVDGRPPRSETFLTPTENLSLQSKNQNQNMNRRKANEKRRKVAPLDSIGSFQMSSFQNRKDEPDLSWEEHK